MEPRVREERGYIVVDAHTDAQLVAVGEFLGGVAEFGEKNRRVFLRRVWFPRERINEEKLRGVVEGMRSCPLCQRGIAMDGSTFIKQSRVRKYETSMIEPVDTASIVGGNILGSLISRKLIDEQLAPRAGQNVATATKFIGAVLSLALPYSVKLDKKLELLSTAVGAAFTWELIRDLAAMGGVNLQTIQAQRPRRIVLRPVSSPPTPGMTPFNETPETLPVATPAGEITLS